MLNALDRELAGSLSQSHASLDRSHSSAIDQPVSTGRQPLTEDKPTKMPSTLLPEPVSTPIYV